jgi:cyclohexyl-isocyanide hydratase
LISCASKRPALGMLPPSAPARFYLELRDYSGDVEQRTHWAYTDLLPLVGATFEKARVVKDGNVFTAGGVSSGIDFALCIVAEIAGKETAQAIQLGIEYDPAPPFTTGHPDRAPASVKALAFNRNAKPREAYLAVLQP